MNTMANVKVHLRTRRGNVNIRKINVIRVATVREKSLENEFFSRSGKSQGISILVREI